MQAERIIGDDEAVLRYPQETIWRLLSDVHGYRDWWPPPLSMRPLDSPPTRVGTRMAVANGPLVRWIVTVVDLCDHSAVLLRYSDGAWRGDTRWMLSTETGVTRVSYHVDIEIVPWWLRLLSKIVDFREQHSRYMGRVFAALDQRLSSTRSSSRDV